MSKTVTFPLSFAVHIGLAAALTVLPLLAEEPLPESADRVVEVDALFVPAPPPPPGRGDTRAARAVPRVPSVAPPLVPTTTSPDARRRSVGAADDVVDDVADVGDEPGAAGGVVGSVLSDLPAASPAPPRVVRISSGLAAPRLVRRIEPAYPLWRSRHACGDRRARGRGGPERARGARQRSGADIHSSTRPRSKPCGSGATSRCC